MVVWVETGNGWEMVDLLDEKLPEPEPTGNDLFDVKEDVKQ